MLDVRTSFVELSSLHHQASDEIELDIESLPNATVLKLYELVVRGPKKAKQVKKSGNGGNKHATGGLNRKSMNEEVEAERIRKLEAKLAGFEQRAYSDPSLLHAPSVFLTTINISASSRPSSCPHRRCCCSSSSPCVRVWLGQR